MTASLKPVAQDKAWDQLLRLADHLPQSLVLIGPDGVGKRRSARALFQWMHCMTTGNAKPCGECLPCRKIAEARHPDLIEISPKGEQILVDDLREMKKMLFFPPMEGKLRLVLIDEAQKLNAASANSLLKTLEEPPRHTRFILITHERGLLLPTIVSRSQFVHFSPLPEKTLRLLLERAQITIPDKLLPLCLDLMAGGFARAPLLSDERTIAFLTELHERIGHKISWSDVVALADQLGAEEWKLELFLDLLLVRAKTRSQSLVGERELGAAAIEAARALEAVYLRRRLGRYANKKLVGLAAAELAGDRL